MKYLLKALKIVLLNVFLALFFLSLIELGWLLSLSRPGLFRYLPAGIKQNIRLQYINCDRKIIQWLPECGQYDGQLGYTLRPGRCTFSNPEFKIECRINSLGVRDDEVSLISPEVIVLGDSFAMGWGVEKQDSFPSIIEREICMKVLNASVSSYGTAREVLLMDRVVTDSLKYLIIQYNDSDFFENKFFFQTGPTPRWRYRHTVRKHMKDTKYYFGKHLVRFVEGLINKTDNAPERPQLSSAARKQAHESEADLFIKALIKSRADLAGVRIIVFEVGRANKNDRLFIDSLAKLIEINSYPPHIENIRTVDISGMLTDEDYFTVDDHINASGHRKIAEVLLGEMTVSRLDVSL